MKQLKIKSMQRGIVIIAGSLALAACVSGAPTSAPTGAGVSGTPTVVTRNVPAPSAVPLASAQRTLNAVPSDARRIVRNGVVLYCETETVTGSRTQRTENCFTAAQWQAISDRSQSLLEQVQNQSAFHPNSTGPQSGGAMNGAH